MTTNKTAAKYGYVITSTPGLLEEGSFALASIALSKGEIEPAKVGLESAAVFRTREEAEKAMFGLVPDGSSPQSYAGLSVESAWDACPQALVYGWVSGQNGFTVPDASL